MDAQHPKLHLIDYPNKWVALSNDDDLNVVAVDETVEGVIEKAAAFGEEDPVLVKAPGVCGSVVY